IAAGQNWTAVWSWEGNYADGPIAGDNGTVLFANNDASNVMKLDPATGLATIIHADTNTGGALSRSKNGALFVASRGLNGGILHLEPQRKMFADSFNGEPIECVGGVVNDLVADARGGVYVAISGSGMFYANPKGVVSTYGEGVPEANGIILSRDERTLYVTNGAVVIAFDVQADGALANQREFGKLRGGQAGDGSAVDAEGRLYVATGSSVDVFAANGEFLGSIPGPQGLHGTFFGGRDKKTLYGIVFYGTWGTASARNQVIAIPTIAQGYTGRAKQYRHLCGSILGLRGGITRAQHSFGSTHWTNRFHGGSSRRMVADGSGADTRPRARHAEAGHGAEAAALVQRDLPDPAPHG
ncbi:MAG TPA: SMP-30/gluconolactonase/LRE family protein, partial [Vicinamibacterales bacterium]